MQQGEYPFMVSLHLYNKQICGGTLLSPTHVLTSAHCVAKFMKKHGHNIFNIMNVQLGSTMIGHGVDHSIHRIAYRSDFLGNEQAKLKNHAIERDISVITVSYLIE